MSKKLYGLLGEHLSHSFSPKFFNTKFKNENIDAEYRSFEIPDISDLMELLSEYPNLVGLNVTVPYKQAILPYLDTMDETAQTVGAVNVVKIKRDEMGDVTELRGYNSDVIGFRESIKPIITAGCKNALVLGTGGASKAVVYALEQLGITPQLVSRHKASDIITYDEINQTLINKCQLIVNTTPLGMYPDVDGCAPIPFNFLTPAHVCYDLVYNPGDTLFLKKSLERGATAKNGNEMLILQALESWRIWNEE